MANVIGYVQEGCIIDYTNSSTAIAYKQIITATNKCFVAAEAIANGATGGVYTEGVFEVTAKDTDVIAVGDELFWDTTNNYLTKTGTGNIFFGIAANTKASTVTTVYALLLHAGTKQMAVQADSTAATVADLKTDFNALLTKLKLNGYMANS